MTTDQLLKLKVHEVMTRDVIFVNENDTMEVVNTIISTSSVHHIPVTDDNGKLKGIISKTDVELLKDWATKLNLKSAELQNRKVFRSQLAMDRMTKDVITVGPNDTLGTCVDILKENLFHSFPVVDGGVLVGIITSFDLVMLAYGKTPLLKK